MRTPALRWAAAAAFTVALAATTACGGDDNPMSGGGGSADSDTNTIIVGSANFPESETIAQIYATALQANGFEVTTRLNIGSREAYVPALKDGSIDVIPDYTGNLLLYLDPNATATSSADVTAALQEAVGSDLVIGTPAPAEDKDAVVVTRETADRWQLTSIGDLAPHSAEVRFGAPAEFQERAVGLPGLERNYGLVISPGNFVAIADGGGPATVAALANGEVTAANIFTTSPAIAKNDFVVLEDPKNNFPAQNVVPLIRGASNSEKLVQVLDAVSAKLTTEELITLNDQVSGDAKQEPQTAAEAWAEQQGLDQPIG